jgi:hypothetical protein
MDQKTRVTASSAGGCSPSGASAVGVAPPQPAKTSEASNIRKMNSFIVFISFSSVIFRWFVVQGTLSVTPWVDNIWCKPHHTIVVEG